MSTRVWFTMEVAASTTLAAWHSKFGDAVGIAGSCAEDENRCSGCIQSLLDSVQFFLVVRIWLKPNGTYMAPRSTAKKLTKPVKNCCIWILAFPTECRWRRAVQALTAVLASSACPPQSAS